MIEAVIELSDRYVNERFFPDKAIDIIDEIILKQRLIPREKRRQDMEVATLNLW